jgi:hypothetical protein
MVLDLPKKEIRMQYRRVAAVVGLSLWLAAGPLYAGGVDLIHFQAMQLVRFSKAIETPPFHLPDLDGKPVALQSFHGKVVLLNFWTTW